MTDLATRYEPQRPGLPRGLVLIGFALAAWAVVAVVVWAALRIAAVI